MQSLLVMSVAAGLRAALRRGADAAAAWVYSMTWSGARAVHDSGIVAAAMLVASAPIAILLPVYVWLFGLAGALLHGAVGGLLALLLAQCWVLRQPTLPLVEDAPSTGGGKASPLLAPPVALGAAAVLSGLERRAPLVAMGLLLALWGGLHVRRQVRPPQAEALSAGTLDDRAVELGLSR